MLSSIAIDAARRRDPADLFCAIHDVFPDRYIDSNDASEWRHDSRGLIDDLGGAIARDELDYPESVRIFDEVHDHADLAYTQLILLCALDAALGQAIPNSAKGATGPVSEVGKRYAQTARLSSAAVSGALLPRFVEGTRPGRQEEELCDFFHHVVRVPDEAMRGEHEWLPEQYDLDFRHRHIGVRIGVVAFVEHLEDFHVEKRRLGSNPSYAIRLKETSALQRRIPIVLGALDRSGAEIGVLPELTLTPALLACWKRAVAEGPPAGSSLRWLLLGSGPLEDSAEPPNRAVLMCRQSGDVLLEQDKMRGFTLKPDQARSWGLAQWLGDETERVEHIRRGKLHTRESRLGRLGVLVCEDVGRVMTIGRTARDRGVSLVISPILSKEVLRYRWEEQAGATLDSESGARVIIVNSLAVVRWREQHDCSEVDRSCGHRPGIALVHAAIQRDERPNAASSWIGETDDPEEVLVARLGSGGVRQILRIGIIGSGLLGETAARMFVAAGHEVALGGGDNERRRRRLARVIGPAARATDIEGAAAFGQIVLLAIPFRAYSILPVEALTGKVVIDAMNYQPLSDGPITALDEARVTSSEVVVDHLTGATVVKALNTLDWRELQKAARPNEYEGRAVLFVSGDDAEAKDRVNSLIDHIGFTAVDAGELSEGGRRQQPGGSLYQCLMQHDEAIETLTRPEAPRSRRSAGDPVQLAARLRQATRPPEPPEPGRFQRRDLDG